MDWLRNYEGRRGVGYLILIVSSFSPTQCALYLLKNNIDTQTNVLHSAMISLALGTLVGLLVVVPFVFIISNEQQPIDDDVSSASILFGFFISLFMQLIILISALYLSKNFYWYYSGNIIFGAIVSALLWIIAIHSHINMAKNKKST